MRRQALYSALLIGAFAVPASAQSMNMSQVMRANVYGVLQVGSQVRPTTVVQTGQANIAGIMQVGANPAASIRQSGRANAAYIGQYEGFLPGTRAGMP